jgi:beta-lactamase class A
MDGGRAAAAPIPSTSETMNNRMAWRIAGVVLALGTAVTACAAVSAPPATAGTTAAAATAHADTVGLRASLLREIDGYRGVVGVTVRDLASDATVSIRGDEPFPSASLIKVPVLVALLEEVEQGRMRLDEPITMVARDRVGGSGILKHMTPGHQLTIGDAAWLMTVISDNTATNLVLDKLDIRPVWTKMEALGLPRTKIHSKTFRRETSIALDSSVVYGLGVTTPDETVELFTLLHRGAAVSAAMDSVAITMLRGNQDGSMLRRWLPAGVPVANKSGSVDRARNDCGIVYGPTTPFAICVMTRENEDTSYGVDAEPHRLVARIARAAFRHLHPDHPLPPLPR